MATYNKILAAVDLADDAVQVLQEASNIAVKEAAELHIVTVIRPLNYAYMGYETTVMSQALLNFESDANASAHKKLTELCKDLDVTSVELHIVFGRASDEIKDLAKSINCDLIVIGSHGKHGFGLLLGSTANGVLHGTPTDVLTIRIKESQ